MQNGALRRRAGAELSRRGEDELARGKRIRRQGTLTARLSALRTPLPENSNDFGLLCAQVYAEMGHRGSFVDQDQCRASSPPAAQPERHSATRQASVASVLTRDSMPKRSKRAAVAPTRTVRVQQRAYDLLRRECQYSMTLRSVFKMLR